MVESDLSKGRPAVLKRLHTVKVLVNKKVTQISGG